MQFVTQQLVSTTCSHNPFLNIPSLSLLQSPITPTLLHQTLIKQSRTLHIKSIRENVMNSQQLSKQNNYGYQNLSCEERNKYDSFVRKLQEWVWKKRMCTKAINSINDRGEKNTDRNDRVEENNGRNHRVEENIGPQVCPSSSPALMQLYTSAPEGQYTLQQIYELHECPALQDEQLYETVPLLYDLSLCYQSPINISIHRLRSPLLFGYNKPMAAMMAQTMKNTIEKPSAKYLLPMLLRRSNIFQLCSKTQLKKNYQLVQLVLVLIKLAKEHGLDQYWPVERLGCLNNAEQIIVEQMADCFHLITQQSSQRLINQMRGQRNSSSRFSNHNNLTSMGLYHQTEYKELDNNSQTFNYSTDTNMDDSRASDFSYALQESQSSKVSWLRTQQIVPSTLAQLQHSKITLRLLKCIKLCQLFYLLTEKSLTQQLDSLLTSYMTILLPIPVECQILKLLNKVLICSRLYLPLSLTAAIAERIFGGWYNSQTNNSSSQNVFSTKRVMEYAMTVLYNQLLNGDRAVERVIELAIAGSVWERKLWQCAELKVNQQMNIASSNFNHQTPLSINYPYTHRLCQLIQRLGSSVNQKQMNCAQNSYENRFALNNNPNNQQVCTLMLLLIDLMRLLVVRWNGFHIFEECLDVLIDFGVVANGDECVGMDQNCQRVCQNDKIIVMDQSFGLQNTFQYSIAYQPHQQASIPQKTELTQGKTYQQLLSESQQTKNSQSSVDNQTSLLNAMNPFALSFKNMTLSQNQRQLISGDGVNEGVKSYCQ